MSKVEKIKVDKIERVKAERRARTNSHTGLHEGGQIERKRRIYLAPSSHARLLSEPSCSAT